MYAELFQSQRSLLRQWEQCGQAKIVVTCKNQKEMNKLQDEAESMGLPTFVVADAGARRWVRNLTSSTKIQTQCVTNVKKISIRLLDL
ncbi:hypothetical protein BVRB_2g032430 [Beta vulgaris subsp. vulgaris]|nr:hypothetical protein BVRB_2g032430 [Beta vulgaris subsp. vulgaris]